MEADNQPKSHFRSSVEPETGPDGHIYNSDLLISDQDQEAALRDFPNAYHILDHPELRLFFAERDLRANKAKRASKAWGFWSILMALVALMFGASESLWRDLDVPWPKLIAGLGAVSGVVSFIIAGFGVLYGRRKKEWLLDRMQTELTRLFHFQMLISRLPEVIQSIETTARLPESVARTSQHFSMLRAEWFSEFRSKFFGNGNQATDTNHQLETILERITELSGVEPQRVWTHAPFVEPVFTEQQVACLNPSALDEVFLVYQRLRLQEQMRFANYQLRIANDHSTARTTSVRISGEFPWFPGRYQPLKVWHSFLQRCWQIGVFLVVAVHGFLLICSLVDSHVASNVLHVLVICFAFVAVAARTLAEGQVLHREIQRYKEYLAVCTELNREFTSNDTSSRRKLELMVRMEITAFEEMRVFLRDTSEASYVF